MVGATVVGGAVVAGAAVVVVGATVVVVSAAAFVLWVVLDDFEAAGEPEPHPAKMSATAANATTNIERLQRGVA